MLRYFLAVIGIFACVGLASAQNDKVVNDRSVEELAASSRSAIVVIKHLGRDGKQEGLGSGFIISADGLIATNLHVIGIARPVTVHLDNGKSYPVKVVHASDRTLDLALLKIDAKNLPVLQLGDSDALKNGQDIIAIGHPQGWQYSVVRGVVSGRPKIDDRQMIQLAIPIERGNSGGPVLDRQGRVQGIVTLKSQVTANLGFAVPVNALKRLQRRPNPIPMDRWVTIGKLNPHQWQVIGDGSWQQRNGIIVGNEAGEGFGGRSLCLSKTNPPIIPFEAAVRVKLSDESGAAGLAFHADGANRHYGFYATSGKLRFTRFLGPDVFSWKVLFEEGSDQYRSGDWNTLKVRVEKNRILCFVNEHLVHESNDSVLSSGKVGLVKFRNPPASFKQFRMGTKLEPLTPSEQVTEEILAMVAKANGKTSEKLVAKASQSIEVLRQRAQDLENQAEELRKLAKKVHAERVLAELQQIAKLPEEKLDLLHGALLIAWLDNEELQINAYQEQVQQIAKEIATNLPKNASEMDKLKALNKGLFAERGFHGSRGDYYNKANSYLNQVIDDREGLPVTLSLLYMEIGRELGLNIVGIGLPGHFIVEFRPSNGKPQLIDVYEDAKFLSRAQAERQSQAITGRPIPKEFWEPVSKKALLVRILANLTGIAEDSEDTSSMLRYLNATLTIDPDLAQERMQRAGIRYQSGDVAGALADVDWVLDHPPADLNRQRVLELRRFLEQKQQP